MKTIKFKVSLDTGFAGCTHTAIMEFDVKDDATEKEIEEQMELETQEWAFGLIDYYHERI